MEEDKNPTWIFKQFKKSGVIEMNNTHKVLMILFL